MSADKFIARQFNFGFSSGNPVHAAVRAIQGFTSDHQIAPPFDARLAILIEELVANICEHGTPDRSEPISLSLSLSSGQIIIHLIDNGTAFDPRTAVDVDLPNPTRGGGVGLSLIKNWTEIVSYQRINDHNELVLSMKIAT